MEFKGTFNGADIYDDYAHHPGELAATFDAVRTMGYQRVVVTAPSLKEDGLWCFTYHSKKNGNTFVVFQPNERVLDVFATRARGKLQ